MVEYNTVNVKLPDSQLIKLKSAVKNRQGTNNLEQIIYLMYRY